MARFFAPDFLRDKALELRVRCVVRDIQHAQRGPSFAKVAGMQMNGHFVPQEVEKLARMLLARIEPDVSFSSGNDLIITHILHSAITTFLNHVASGREKALNYVNPASDADGRLRNRL
mmetsp:Transcript_16876/g.52424  ORF Transcript_16876/g.52424 Transcript_16876/m.52424 type:complete len:118 (+) Transcript_16876:845-1198(+)